MQATTYDLWYLYVKQWLNEHVDPASLARAKQEWREYNKETEHPMAFYDWLVMYGVDGQAPACYSEWLDNEYREGIYDA